MIESADTNLYGHVADGGCWTMYSILKKEGSSMSRKSSREPHPFELVMDELAIEKDSWDLELHLNGCLAGYQAEPTYGSAVYFAFEAVSGIARDVSIRAKTGELNPDDLDNDWVIKPRTG